MLQNKISILLVNTVFMVQALSCLKVDGVVLDVWNIKKEPWFVSPYFLEDKDR